MLELLVHPMPFFAFAPLGGRYTSIVTTLHLDERLAVSFADHGVPPDARILMINYTPQDGGLFPLEVHGNTPTRHIVPSDVLLQPVPLLAPRDGVEDTEVLILVAWVGANSPPQGWDQLVQAFEAFGTNRFESIVLPSNVAVEVSLERLLRRWFEESAGKKRVDALFRERASYSDQLNVLLPTLADAKGLPRVPDEVRGHLNTLRSYRNDIAHTGMLEAALSRDEASKLLCSALIAFRYINLLLDEAFRRV